MRLNLMTIALALACFIIVGAVVLATRAPKEPVPELVNGSIVPAVGMDSCAGSSCIIIDTSCGLCCNYAAIGSAHEQTYARMYNLGCDKYMGRTCNCTELTHYPSCIEDKCQLKEWPKAEPAPAPKEAQPAPAPAPAPEELAPAVPPEPEALPNDLFAPLPENLHEALPETSPDAAPF